MILEVVGVLRARSVTLSWMFASTNDRIELVVDGREREKPLHCSTLVWWFILCNNYIIVLFTTFSLILECFHWYQTSWFNPCLQQHQFIIINLKNYNNIIHVMIQLLKQFHNYTFITTTLIFRFCKENKFNYTFI